MTDFVKAADGIRIAYETVGEGPSVVLVHGFANWKAPGWFDTLTVAGCRVIAMDCRGHGESDKPHDPAFYNHALMAEDVVAVMDAAGVGDAFLMGYSMGGFISMHVLMDHPELLRKVVIGGVGGSYLGPAFGSRDAIAEALLEPDKSKITDPVQRSFREFAEQSGKDIQALAACLRGKRHLFTATELSQSQRPVRPMLWQLLSRMAAS
jgi:pimeloyl-ACP methyl ester carboxylesterase